MKRTLSCSLLVGVTLLGFSSSTLAQTTPTSPSKTPPVKSAPRSKAASEAKGTAFVSPIVKDTAEFNQRLRRSSRPDVQPLRQRRAGIK